MHPAGGAALCRTNIVYPDLPPFGPNVVSTAAYNVVPRRVTLRVVLVKTAAWNEAYPGVVGGGSFTHIEAVSLQGIVVQAQLRRQGLGPQGFGMGDQVPYHLGATFDVLLFPFLSLVLWLLILRVWSRSLRRLVQGIAPELVGVVVAPAVDAVAKDHIAVHAVPSVRPVQRLERV